ncbi:MAG TPA: S53 family peptidase [Tepidisphaeraceae bacterium]|jgi:hypothetical protein|nr:S53 family peptidase [Tepidisphaeraceae bacterium]
MQHAKNRRHDKNRERRDPARAIEPLEARRLLSATVIPVNLSQVVHPALSLTPAATTSGVGGYTPAQIRQAYGFDQATFANGSVQGNGAGQTIAIIDPYSDPNIANDLNTFDAQYGIAAPPSFKNVSETGGSVASIATDAGWAGEIALDVEWAHAIAPGANILLVTANSASLGDLLTAVDYARNAPGVSTVSMSWGGSEFYRQTAYDSYFTTPAGHTGVTFVAASGDSGSFWGPQWPASSPNVLSVGGTTLTLNASGTYGSETGWGGSGGGISSVESEPAYQAGVQNTGARTTPDVSYNADPNTGFAIYDSVPYQGQSGWTVVGGTSAGAPQWAALVSIADQGRALNHLGTLDGVNQTLPMLYSMYNGNGTYTTSFHDVSTGASSWFMSAGQGYDGVTGLGSPNASAIASALAGSAPAASSTAIANAGAARGAARAAIRHADDVANASPVSTAAVSSVFSEVTIRSSTTLSRVGSAESVVPELSPSRFAGEAGTALSASSINAAAALDGSLASWFNSGGPAAGRAIQGAGAVAQSLARALSPSAAPAGAAPAVAKAVLSAASPVIAAAPERVLYHFANFDPIATFSDALKSFANDSASIPLLGAADSEGHSTRAWTITGVVLAVDAMLVARWYSDRAAVRKAKAKASVAGMCGEIDPNEAWRN